MLGVGLNQWVPKSLASVALPTPKSWGEWEGLIWEHGFLPHIKNTPLVEMFHAAGVSVAKWTVNDRKTMDRLIDNGADMIITDDVPLLREAEHLEESSVGDFGSES